MMLFRRAVIIFVLLLNSHVFAQGLAIVSPQDNDLFIKGDLVTFIGSRTDAQGAPLPGDQLIWKSDKDGLLGKGEQISSLLSGGQHLITMEVQDASGTLTSNQIVIFVEGGK